MYGVLVVDWIWYFFCFDGCFECVKFWLVGLIIFGWMIFMVLIVVVFGVNLFVFLIRDIFKVFDLNIYYVLLCVDFLFILVKVIGMLLFMWVFVVIFVKCFYDCDKFVWWLFVYFVIFGLFK